MIVLSISRHSHDYRLFNTKMICKLGYNSVANRTVTIPTGKAVLYPVLNAEISFSDFPNAKGEDDLKRALESDLSAATYVGTKLNEIPCHIKG